MAGVRVRLPGELEQKFRRAAMRRFGYGKGALSLAAEEAIRNWLASVPGEVEFEGDPVKAIEGLLADIDIDSVELQHLAMEIWAGRVKGVPGGRKRAPRGAARKVKEGRL